MNVPPHVFEAIALAKCDYESAYAERPCSICRAPVRAPNPYPVCSACRKTHSQRQERAAYLTTKAVRNGTLPSATTLACADCGAPAWCYDHRDYNRPLEVAPVCRSCNSKRGVAKAA